MKPAQIFMVVDLAGTSGSFELISALLVVCDKGYVDICGMHYDIVYSRGTKVIRFEEEEEEEYVIADGGSKIYPLHQYGRQYLIQLFILHKKES